MGTPPRWPSSSDLASPQRSRHSSCWSVSGPPSTAGLAARAADSRAGDSEPKPAQAAPSEKAAKAKTKAVVPFEMLPTNHMLVEARINDKGPYRLIFDLGAPVTLAEQPGERGRGRGQARRAAIVPVRDAGRGRGRAGSRSASSRPTSCRSSSSTTPCSRPWRTSPGGQIDGIMGFTFFARFKTTIDYHAREMTFEPIDYEVRDLLKELPDRLMGPKVAQRRVLAPSGLWGLRLGEPAGGLDDQGVADSEGPRRIARQPRPGSSPVTCSAPSTAAGSPRSRTSTTPPRK